MVKNIGKMKIMMGDDFFSQMDKKMSKGQAGKLDEIKKELPQRRLSKEKEKKDEPSASQPPKPPSHVTARSTNRTIENSSMLSNLPKGDISEQVQ
jgi:hypothetical protein